MSTTTKRDVRPGVAINLQQDNTGSGDRVGSRTASRATCPRRMAAAAGLLACISAGASAQLLGPRERATPDAPEQAPRPTGLLAPTDPLSRLGRPPASLVAEQQRLPEIAYERLIQTDQDGEIIPLEKPAEYLIVERHPTMTRRLRERALAELPNFRGRMRDLVVENLDLVESIAGGALDRMNTREPATLREAQALVEPFVVSPLEALAEVGALTPTQYSLGAKMNETYVRATLNARLEAVVGRPQAPTDIILRHFFEEALSPMTYEYGLLLRRVADRPEYYITASGLSDQLADPRPVVEALSGVEVEPGLGGADPVRQVLSAVLSLEQRRAMLRAAAKDVSAETGASGEASEQAGPTEGDD